MNGIRYNRLWIFVLLLAACKGKDQQAGLPEDIYFDYQLHAAEGDDNLTILLQYREDDEEGDGRAIGSSGAVTFDGEAVLPDSAKMGGYFYELHKPISGFTGEHKVILKGPGHEQWEETFSFRPMVLLSNIPDTVRRTDIELELEGIENDDRVRALVTDTSFISDGINRVTSVRNGRLVIEADELNRLANGPVQLELIREFERDIERDGRVTGRLLITYSLKREFFLTD